MSLFDQFLGWAGAHPGWLLAAGFALAFIEALAVVGIVMPGILLLFMLGAVVGWNPPLLVALSTALILGAVAGDGLSFWLGHRLRGRLDQAWPFRGNPHWLEQGQRFFLDYGGRSIFIARFVGPLRPVVPLVAGSMGMPARSFVPRMLVACLLWGPVMLLPGVLFGESLALAAEFGGRLTILLLILVAGLWFIAWLTRLVYEASARRTQWWMKNLALWVRRHPRLGRGLGALIEPGRREVQSVIILGVLLVVSLAALITALLLSPFSVSAWDAGFRFSGLAASLRNHFADPALLAVKLAASPPVMAALVALVAAVLAISRRPVALLHWLLATVGGALLAILLNALTGVLLGRPPEPGSVAQVPHIGFAMNVVVVGFAAQLLARELRPRRRKWLYLACVVSLSLFGFTEFYFAAATLNGLIAGLTLAAVWLALVGIGYRTRARSLPRPVRLGLVIAVGWAVAAGLAVERWHGEFAERFRLEPPRATAPGEVWWSDGWRTLPAARGRIGAPDRLAFDAQIALPLETLARTLRAHGWEAPPPMNARRLRALVAARPDPDRLGHFGRDHAGSPQRLVLRRRGDDGRVVLLRAWDSGLRLLPEHTPVWQVQVRTLEPVRRLGFFNTWRELDAARDQAIRRLREAGRQWQWRQPAAEAPWLVRRQPSGSPGGPSDS